MVSQNEILSQFDLSSIQRVINQTQETNQISFLDLVKNLIRGDINYNFDLIISTVLQSFLGEVNENKMLLVSVCMVGIVSAVLRVICGAFENHQIADTGYYSMYLVLSALLMKSFSVTSEVADQTITNLTEFMQVLLPAFALSVGMSSGQTGAAGFYGVALFLITLILKVILQIILPMIKIYVILCLVNHMSGGEYFKQLTVLLKKFIGFLLKTLLGVSIGLNMVQGMIAPVIDSVKRGVVSKAVSAIPGFGSITNSVMETVVGSAILIKNGIGVAGLLVLGLICLRPVIQLCAFYLMYQLTAVILSPIAQKDMTESLVEIGESSRLLLKAVLTSLMLFVITIAIAVISTNK